MATKDGVGVNIEIESHATETVVTDDRHMLAIDTESGKAADQKLLRALFAER